MKNTTEKTSRQFNWHHPAVRWVFQTSLLFGLWIVLSGKIEALFLLPGILSSILVVIVTERIFHPNQTIGFKMPPTSIFWLLKTTLRMVHYLPYFLWEILVANFHVALLILRPSMPVNPSLIEFESPLETESANALLAQSITLTPGTITVDMSQHRLLVHCLSAGTRQSLIQGQLVNRVAKVFGQPEQNFIHIKEITDLEEISW